MIEKNTYVVLHDDEGLYRVGEHDPSTGKYELQPVSYKNVQHAVEDSFTPLPEQTLQYVFAHAIHENVARGFSIGFAFLRMIRVIGGYHEFLKLKPRIESVYFRLVGNENKQAFEDAITAKLHPHNWLRMDNPQIKGYKGLNHFMGSGSCYSILEMLQRADQHNDFEKALIDYHLLPEDTRFFVKDQLERDFKKMQGLYELFLTNTEPTQN